MEPIYEERKRKAYLILKLYTEKTQPKLAKDLGISVKTLSDFIADFNIDHRVVRTEGNSETGKLIKPGIYWDKYSFLDDINI